MNLLNLIKQFGQANYNYGLFNGADKLQKQFDEERTKYFKEIVSQIDCRVMPNEVVAGDIKLMFGEDTEKYSLWCEIVNDVFMEYDTTSEGEDAQILIDKIERLLKLVSQREA